MRLILQISILSLLCLGNAAIGQNTNTKTIYFDQNKFAVGDKYKPLLRNLALICKSDTTSYVKIIAYTDKTGTVSYNNLLAKKRAYAVFNYMRAYAKIDTTKVYITWLGESDEEYDLHLENAHLQKRCVDIWMQFNR